MLFWDMNDSHMGIQKLQHAYKMIISNKRKFYVTIHALYSFINDTMSEGY